MMGMGGMGMMGMGGMGMGGMGRMGMGGMGMGGFGGGGSQGQRGFTADATSRRDEILTADQQLTAAQLEAIRRRAQDGQKADGARADAIQEVTSQEPPIYVVINQTHGLIIVRTSDQEAMDSIASLIEELDRPTPQVLLEVKILEITLGDQFKSAFDFEFNDNGTPVTDDDGNAVNSSLMNTATQEFLGAAGSVITNGHAAGMGNFGLDPDGSTFVYQFLNDKFRARIQLLNDENRVNVIATPMLLASNNRPASLRIGEERRLTDGVTTDTVASQAGTTTGTTIETSQQQIGTSLMLLPKINADRTVTLTVFQERTGDDTGKTDIIPISSTEVVARPVISNATTVNTIVARDGLTMAIGGLIEERVVRRQIKVPLLGDLPVLGTLFRKEFSQDRKTELVVLLTPHAISTPEATGRVTQGRLKVLSSHNYVRNGFEDREGHHGVNNLPPNYGEGMPNSFYQILPGRFQLK
ncbi:MAG: type II secretion system protein GspD, partial [Planctomycetaceae bacterium]|nr:type II secretion system protein GspD [Planctomycetaceae bacterium]